MGVSVCVCVGGGGGGNIVFQPINIKLLHFTSLPDGSRQASLLDCSATEMVCIICERVERLGAVSSWTSEKHAQLPS